MLTEAQTRVVDQLLSDEGHKRDHLVVALSGAHAYGFPSPDSDLDVKAIHIAPTTQLLGLGHIEASADFLGFIDEVEIDYTSNEIGSVLAGIIKGNGNYIERVLGAIILRTSPLHESLIPLCRAALSRRVHGHYSGFSRNQLTRVERDAKPSAKRVLYVLRTALTGLHLLRAGELVVDVTQLLDDYGYPHGHVLVERKKAGENVLLDDKARWLSDLDRVIEQLDRALADSVLPEEPPNADALDAWLVAARRAQLG